METEAQSPVLEPGSKIYNEVEQCIERWKDREGNLIMILHEIQNACGYVPREASLLLSKQLGVPMARIYEVLTFYHYFRLVARGRHNVTVCNGTACYLKGSGPILEQWKSRLGIKEGQTTTDQVFHLETVRCIGCCGMSPAMVLDGKTLGKVKPDQIQGLIDRIRKEES